MGFGFGLGLGLSHAGAPAWTPASISSKVLYWLRADLGFNSGAKTWTDQVNGIVFTAASTAPAQDSSGLNGQKRLVFSDLTGLAAMKMTGSISSQSATIGQAFAIGKSALATSERPTNGLWEIGSTIGSYFQYSDGSVYEGALSTGRPNDGTNPLGVGNGTFAYEVKQAGSTRTQYFGGTLFDTQAGNTCAFNTSPIIGGSSPVALNGELEEILVLNNNMTTPEHASWVSYVLSRYGIAA